MKKLVIVESPAKIKTISKILGSEFKIMSTVGHIKDLPKKKLGITIGDTIELEYVVMDDKEKVIADICKEASKSDEVYLASDPDREGEIISWHIGQEIEKVIKNKKNIHRITFNEITKPAILEALEHTTKVDLQKVAAQQARRILDRWVGYEVSPVLWKKIAPGLSAGRVQSVALRMICEREIAIREFKAEEYWSITSEFGHGKSKFEAELTHIGKNKAEITNEKDATKTVAGIKKAEFLIDSITDKNRLKNPAPPFMTSTLQQAAVNQLGFSVKKTMQLAQQLYEGVPLDDASSPVALITYMRTDSLRISDTAIKQTRDHIAKHFDKEYLPSKANVYSASKAGKAQDAHEAVRPIDVDLSPAKVKSFLSKDLAKLYELIWKRFVACQMKPAEYAQRQVVLKGGEFTFKVTGSTLIFDGFLKVYNDDSDEKEQKVVLPKTLAAKDPVDLLKVLPKQHFTQPPPRYTEASLVKDLEKDGIGRPSTYASILSTIRARAYTDLDDKKRFVPTELGMTVTKVLKEHMAQIMDFKFTANMEENLDKIAEGDLDRDILLKAFYKDFQKDLDAFKDVDGKGKKVSEPTELTCPKCEKHKLAIRFGKSGEFLGCLGYPDCDFTSNFKRNEEGTISLTKFEEPKMLNEKCPQCSKPLREVIGKFGPFIACSGYPDCKYIHKNVAKVKCPDCQGDLVERRWKGGKFWGCANYPKCKFAVFSDIEETPCPKCKRPFLAKKTDRQENVTLFCSDKNCGYKP